MLWRCLAARGTGTLVRIEGTMDAEKYITILWENLELVQRLTFQQDNNPKSAKKTKEWPGVPSIRT